MGKGAGKGGLVNYDANNMFKIIFKLHGSVIKTVWPNMAIAAAIAVFATILRASMGPDDYIIKDVKGHATLGTALAFLNVFRSNLSYGRYWDGRGQLGILLKSGRELIRQIVCYTRIPQDDRDKQVLRELQDDVARLTNCLFGSIILGMQHAADPKGTPEYNLDASIIGSKVTVGENGQPMMNELGQPMHQSHFILLPHEKSRIIGAEGDRKNKGRPSIIATMLGHKVYHIYHKGWMNAAVLKKVDSNIEGFIGAWMACEKTVSTPMVFPYTQMLCLFMVLFVYTFPLPLAHIFYNDGNQMNGFIITPFISALVAYAFFGMNAVGVEIENPFGDDENDLPIPGMRARLEADTQSIMQMRIDSNEPGATNPQHGGGGMGGHPHHAHDRHYDGIERGGGGGGQGGMMDDPSMKGAYP